MTPRTSNRPAPIKMSSPTSTFSWVSNSGRIRAPPLRSNACEYVPSRSVSVPWKGNASCTARSSIILVTGVAASVLTIVSISMASDVAVIRPAISSRAMVSCTTGVKGLFDRTIMSAANRARASLVSTIPTL